MPHDGRGKGPVAVQVAEADAHGLWSMLLARRAWSQPTRLSDGT